MVTVHAGKRGGVISRYASHLMIGPLVEMCEKKPDTLIRGNEKLLQHCGCGLLAVCLHNCLTWLVGSEQQTVLLDCYIYEEIGL